MHGGERDGERKRAGKLFRPGNFVSWLFFLSAQWETAPMCRIRWISFFLFLRTLNREARGSREDIKRRTGTTETVDMEDMNM